MSIVHILPEAVDLYAEYLVEHAALGEDHHRILEEKEHEEEEGKASFPLPYVLFFVGFMLMLLLD